VDRAVGDLNGAPRQVTPCVTITEEAKALLRDPHGRLGLHAPLALDRHDVTRREPKPGDEDDADWTIRRRDLWALRVAEGQDVADGDARLVMVDGWDSSAISSRCASTSRARTGASAWRRPPDRVAMVFALDKDDGGLRAFPRPSMPRRIARAWTSATGSGSSSPTTARPSRRFRGTGASRGPAPATHAFAWQRAMSGRWLQERVDQVRTVSGAGSASVEDLVETLKVNRGKRISPLSARACGHR
jgi:hypothetical protein